MPLLLRNIPLGLDESEEVLPARAARRLKLPTDAIRVWGVVRRSIDARADSVQLMYNLELALDAPRTEQRLARRLHRTDVNVLEPKGEVEIRIGAEPLGAPPVVVGFGPAGMFAALRLAEHGYEPIVLERGRRVRDRHVDVMKRFWRQRDFDPDSNMLFGEGGAGCYSDGKLRTRIRDPRVRDVLAALYRHGADPDILIDARPHIGSDKLPMICRRIRQRIESLGGRVRFGQAVEGFELGDGALRRLRLRGGEALRLDDGSAATPVILAVGHSARKTFRSLYAAGFELRVKPFQVGVRIEHPQEQIDRWQYGSAAGHPRLGSAEYRVVAKGRHGGRDVFSFCMCPGGQIVPCNESAGLLAVNGASRAGRAGPYGNSGLVVTLGPDEIGDDPMAVLDRLESWERQAFEVAGGDYRAPAQRASDFVAGRVSEGEIAGSYPLGCSWCELRGMLPESVASALAAALPQLDRRMPGYAGPEAMLVAPETRASCPIRIVRDNESRASLSAGNVYPAGEGAGYAGGIVSSAVDGLRTAEAIMARFAPPRRHGG